MRADYGSRAYWDGRYADMDGAPAATASATTFEWLGAYERYASMIMDHIAQLAQTHSDLDKTLGRGSGLRLLVPGCGDSRLVQDLASCGDPRVAVVVGVDYSRGVVEQMRRIVVRTMAAESETTTNCEESETAVRHCNEITHRKEIAAEMVYAWADCLNLERQDRNNMDNAIVHRYAPYDLVVDKSTLDAIACIGDGGDDNYGANDNNVGNTPTTRYLRQLASVTRPGGMLLLISHSPAREECFREAAANTLASATSSTTGTTASQSPSHQQWDLSTFQCNKVLVDKGGWRVNDARTQSGCYVPETFHYVYSVRRL